MLVLPPSVALYLYLDPIDMRKSFNGLSIAARELVGADPLSGHLFIFLNRSRNLCKILWWSSGGFCLLCKRLSRGRFVLPERSLLDPSHVRIDAGQLAVFLEGLDLSAGKNNRLWSPLAIQ